MGNISIEALRRTFSYDGTTGVLRWKDCYFKSFNGNIAGSVNGDGYLHVKVFRRSIKVHRIAWALHYGSWPSIIDHINRDKLDNRIANLRAVSHGQNQQNRIDPQSNNKLGILGVSRFGNRFRSVIYADGNARYLGTFDTPAKAQQAYLNAKARLHIGAQAR